MRPRFQFAPSARRVSVCACGLWIAFLAGILLICPLAAPAQDAMPSAIGRVEGRDISCDNGIPANGGSTSVGTSLYVSNGTVVTVHSGQAIMTLFGGGEVGICGPAKLSVLLSGDSITLALNFGRVRVNLPGNTNLRIFTPTIVGTPLGISGRPRDMTVGLGLDDSLCVLATSGAIELEHQFSGEKLIVPQSGEFFLNAGRLLPVAGTPGSCQCHAAAAIPAAPRPVTPDYAKNVAPLTAPVPTPAPQPVAVEPVPEPATKPNIEVSLLAEANETHPIVPDVKNPVPAAPPALAPVYTAVLPPLTFIAGSPTRPPDPAPDMVVLIREAKVEPEWEFSGRVGPPEFAQAMQHALGEKPAVAQQQPPVEDPPAAKPAKKKGGFWASLKHAFGGGTPD
jgi:hypothetical protein